MRIKTTKTGEPVTKTGKPVRKTAALAQSEAMGRYTAKKEKQTANATQLAKVQAEAKARAEAKKIANAGTYKTNAKGQLVLSDGRVVNYKGGVTPQKLKNANVKVTPPSKFGMYKGKK